MKIKILLGTLTMITILTACGKNTANNQMEYTAEEIKQESATENNLSNENISEQISLDLSEIMNQGDVLIDNISGIAALSNSERYEKILTCEKAVDSINDICDKIINYSDDANFAGLIYQVRLLKNAAPEKMTSDDSNIVSGTIPLYAVYLQQLSSSFHYFQQYSDYLTNNSEKPQETEYFSECNDIPKPDSCISGIIYDSKIDAQGNVQYMYLLGDEENTANNLYNVYLNAIKMNSSLDVTIENNVAYITQNGELVALTMAGNDTPKGYFIMISFKSY